MSYIDIDGLAQLGKPVRVVLAIRRTEYRYGYLAREGLELIPITTKTTQGTEIVQEGFVTPNDARIGREPKLVDDLHIVNCHLTEDEQRALRRQQRRTEEPRDEQPRREYRDRDRDEEG